MLLYLYPIYAIVSVDWIIHHGGLLLNRVQGPSMGFFFFARLLWFDVSDKFVVNQKGKIFFFEKN